MIITKQNTNQAPGYSDGHGNPDENIRTCPRCHGDGQYMGNQKGGFAYLIKCNMCDGNGVVALDNTEVAA